MTTENFISPIELKLKSAGKNVIACGSVHTFDDKNLEFVIAGLRLIFDFNSDSEGQRLKKEAIDDMSIKIKVFNFDNSLGTGTTSPLPIGRIGGKRLYLSFIISALSKGASKLVTYTFFLGESADE